MSVFSGTWTEALKPVLDSIRRSDAAARLAEAAHYTSLPPAQQRALVEFVVGLAEGAGDFYKGAVLTLDDICTPDRSGFVIESLDVAYQQWRAAKIATGVAEVDLTPLHYVKVSRGQPGMIVRSLLGELGSGYTWAGKRIPRTQNVRWQNLAGMVLAGGDDVATIVRRLNDPAAVETAVRNVVGTAEATAEYSRKIGTLIDRLAGGSGAALTEGQAAALLGNLAARANAGKAVPNFDELVEILVNGMKSVDDEVEAVGGSVDELLEVDGANNYFLDLVTRSGYGTGSLYEMRLAAERMQILRADGIDNPAALLTMQVPMGDGLKGFDLGWFTSDFRELVVMQAKSYKDLSKLTTAVKNNELIRQVASDLKRVKSHVPPFTVTIDGQAIPIARTMEWRVDWRRINESSFATAKELADAQAALTAAAVDLNKKLKDPAWRALIGLGPGDPEFQINLVLDGAEAL